MSNIKKIILTLMLVCLSACGPLPEHEMMRVSSPDQLVDAVLVRVDTFAMDNYAYKIYVVPAGQKAGKEENTILVAEDLDGVKITWVAKQLVVSFASGEVFQYHNRWLSAQIKDQQTVDFYEVKIFLVDRNSPIRPE